MPCTKDIFGKGNSLSTSQFMKTDVNKIMPREDGTHNFASAFISDTLGI